MPHALPFTVDLSSGDGLTAISDAFGQPDVVINCAALFVPRVCEIDPEAAMSINVPTTLVKWLSSFRESTLLIHLSTDQGSLYANPKAYFRGRVTVASVKNFQLISVGPQPAASRAGTGAPSVSYQMQLSSSSSDHDKVILRFKKVGKDMFMMNYRYPLSAF